MPIKPLVETFSVTPSRMPEPGRSGPDIDHHLMARLAGDIMNKPPHELVELAKCNPGLVQEWLEDFRRRKWEADREARLWAACVSRLAHVLPKIIPDAAE
jgi:hypothetical protein